MSQPCSLDMKCVLRSVFSAQLLVFELFYDTNAEAELPDGRTPVRLKQIAEKPFNTPATALCQIGGHIFHSEGSHVRALLLILFVSKSKGALERREA